MPYKSNSSQTSRVYKKRVQPDFSSVLLTTDVSLNIPVVVPEIVEEIVPEIVEEIVPEIVEEIVPEIVEEIVPEIVEEIVPDIIEEVVPDFIPPPPIFSEDGTKILNYRTNRYVKVGGAIDLKFNLSKMD